MVAVGGGNVRLVCIQIQFSHCQGVACGIALLAAQWVSELVECDPSCLLAGCVVCVWLQDESNAQRERRRGGVGVLKQEEGGAVAPSVPAARPAGSSSSTGDPLRLGMGPVLTIAWVRWGFVKLDQCVLLKGGGVGCCLRRPVIVSGGFT